MTKNATEQAIQTFINRSCNFALPLFTADTAATNSIAVTPFILAYIGGRNVRGCTSNPIFRKFTPKRIATAKGITMDKTMIQFLYFFSASVIPILLFLYF